MIRTSTLTACASPSAMDFILLEKAQQLGLDLDGDIADFVQEQGAAVRAANDAEEIAVRAGEGALAIAEQLALEHVARDRGAVEGHEGVFGAIRRAMDDARERLFARTCFPADKNRQIARSDLLGGTDYRLRVTDGSAIEEHRCF